ncbi:hypothetical protein FHS20_004407 [Phyllobacterium endophyticum]|nr:hypothetical protein [Phyllobacterium endophyticum]
MGIAWSLKMHPHDVDDELTNAADPITDMWTNP